MLCEGLETNTLNNETNWAYMYHIKIILDNCGLGYLWIHQSNIRINYETIKTRIIDFHFQQWYRAINSSPSLDSYCLVKHTFCFKTYLDNIKLLRYKAALTKLRISSHDL